MSDDREKLAREMFYASDHHHRADIAIAYAERQVAAAVALIEDLIIATPATGFREGYNEALRDATGNIKLALSSAHAGAGHE